MKSRIHGGADALGPVRWDFSSNANACGPCPTALQAVQNADAAHYPDPTYTRLRSALADLHGVDAARVLLAASASECIQRLTAWRWRAGDRRFWTPPHAYGDYAHAASAWGLEQVHEPGQAQLGWLCDPGSPLGQGETLEVVRALLDPTPRTVVLDRAYAPLRLRGDSALSEAQLDRVWQLWSPNKALGLTGVRAAYAIAPRGADAALLARLHALAPSWPVGAHGVALLQAWATVDAHDWLQDCRATLRGWKARQIDLLQAAGWRVAPSAANFLVAAGADGAGVEGRFGLNPLLTALRAQGIKLRDCASFGLPGRVRMAVVAPAVQDALMAALDDVTRKDMA